MHQNVVSAFPAKRLIIKRVGAVVPQEERMAYKDKKGVVENLGDVTRGRREEVKIAKTIFLILLGGVANTALTIRILIHWGLTPFPSVTLRMRSTPGMEISSTAPQGQ